MSYPKTFSIYCSGSASRIRKFYSFCDNITKFSPNTVLYDGNNENVEEELKKLFRKKLKVLNISCLTSDERNRIHSITSNWIHENLISSKSEYLLCFGDKILKKEIINSYQKKLLNFHPSLLPSFAGLKSIDQAMKSNVSFLGNTVHYISEKVDEGDIIKQIAMHRIDFNSYEDVLELQFPLIKFVLRDLLDYKIEDNEMLCELKERKAAFFFEFEHRDSLD